MTPLPDPHRLALKLGDLQFALEEGRAYDVGRGAQNHIKINHGTVSEKHCSLSWVDGALVIEDQGSQHGTLVDGRVVHGLQPIHPGQKVRLGGIELELLETSKGLTVPRKFGDVPWRHRDQISFNQLMAEELRRAPWFTLSLVIHAAIFLLLFYLCEETAPRGRDAAALGLQENQEEDEVERDQAPEEEVTVEDDPVEIELIEDPFEAQIETPVDNDMFDEFEIAPGLADGGSWMTKVKGGEGILGHGTVGGGGFRKKVKDIRRSGLEIVFVFDSTGSMGSILDGTKARIAHMVEMLHELVPDARIGVVTYRDKGPEEDYTTRHAPLSLDVYRAINFMQVIGARGGGDRAEAVLEGLTSAIRQKWGSEARRVVVLIGDAPAHKHSKSKIKGLLRGFAANGRSFVHAIGTSPFSRAPQSDTRKSFQAIAEAGKGEYLDFENEKRVLQQVLSLAFGREFRRNIDEVSELLGARMKKITSRALDVVQRGDIQEIEKWLRREPVSDDIIKALARSKDKKVAHGLVDLLAKSSFPEHGRQATAFALQSILGGQLRDVMHSILRDADQEGTAARRLPWKLGAISGKQAERLRRHIERS